MITIALPLALLAVLADDWKLHEADGSLTSREVLAEITDDHRVLFSSIDFEFLHEVAAGDRVAHHARFTLTFSDSGRAAERAGQTIELSEMIFHHFNGSTICESWRITFPDHL